jgi:hypothetical protein
MSSRFVKENAVIPLPVKAGEDHSGKRGFLVKLAVVGGVAFAALNDSATVPAFGVILDGENEGGFDSVLVLGGQVVVKGKLGGAVTAVGQTLMQKNDGTFVVETTGARVSTAIATELGSTDELIGIIPLQPIKVPAITAVTVATADASDLASAIALANALKVQLNALLVDLTAEEAAE